MTTEREYRGVPLHEADGWVVVYRWDERQAWCPLASTYAGTRSDAIRRFNEIWVRPNEYRRLQRKSLAQAVRARLVPESDLREGARE